MAVNTGKLAPALEVLNVKRNRQRRQRLREVTVGYEDQQEFSTSAGQLSEGMGFLSSP